MLFFCQKVIAIFMIMLSFAGLMNIPFFDAMDRDCLRMCWVCLSALTRFLGLLIVIPVPLQSDDTVEVCRLMMVASMAIHEFIFRIMSLAPPVILNLSLRDRVFFDFHGHDYYGRDVFTNICKQRYLFWLNTGETLESFLQIVRQTALRFFRITRSGNPRQRIGRYKLSITNRVLLVFIWLRKYPHIDTLALIFDVSPQTISALLYQGLGVLWHHFRSEVTWPSIRQWNVMRGTWPMFPNAVGCIDVTPHEIQRPSNEPQREWTPPLPPFKYTDDLRQQWAHSFFCKLGFWEVLMIL